MRGEASRVAVVTGGSRGIGRGIALELAGLGFSLVVNYRSDAAAAQECCRLAEQRGAPDAFPVQADIANLEQGRSLLDHALERFQRVDFWVNNAGVAPLHRFDLLDTTPESWDRVLATNLRGPFFLTQSVATAMLDLKERGLIADPQIVFITSISSEIASTNRGEYCVAKAALSMAVQLFALRLAALGIRVAEIRPGLIDTEMTRGVHEIYSGRIASGLVPIARWGRPEDVGRAVAALASGTFPYSTGLVLHVDGGLNLRAL
jgi:NAD(P)-dependent dehydrogenase (short-subunit alcohol dehydrogenase family)